MEVLLDTNFIISCINKKIDFNYELTSKGFKVVVPREVLEELKDLRLNVNHNDRIAIDLALEMLGSKGYKKIKLGNESVDNGLIKKGKMGYYIATLDAAIKRTVPNKIYIKSSSNNLEIEKGN